MQLNNKTVVVTGAQGGIGHHLVQLLQGQQANVIAVGRKKERGIIQCDLADSNSVDSLCAELKQKDVDILINLAGMMYFGSLKQQAAANLEELITVNLTTPIKLSQAVLPLMEKKGQGSIVNIGSIFGSLPFPYFSAYSSTKAGLKGFSDSLLREYKNTGITVSHISPRAVDTPFNTNNISLFNKRTKASADSPEKVAGIILEAIVSQKSNVNIGFAENIFVKINHLLPSLVDKALIEKRNIANKIS